MNDLAKKNNGKEKSQSGYAFCVGFLPWWPENPYQLLLRDELKKRRVRVIGNPPLSILRILVNRDGLDVVHVHWPHGLYYENYWRFPYVLLVLLLYRLRKNNIVWTVHELDFYETRRPVFDRVMKWFLTKVCRGLIVHSRSSGIEFERRYRFHRDFHLAYHPSYYGHYANGISRTVARSRLGIGQERTVFLYFGYIKPYKGVEGLIEDFRAIRDDNSVLLVVGKPLDESVKRSTKKLAEGDGRIRAILEYVPDEDIQLYFNAADIVVFPFRRTHTSGSIMLALSFGKPVIAPALSSIPEYVDERMAVLFDPDDPRGLQIAMETAMAANLGGMGEAALARAKELNWDAFASTHADVYAEIAGREQMWIT